MNYNSPFRTSFRTDCGDFADSICEVFAGRNIRHTLTTINREYLIQVDLPKELAREILKEENII